MLNYKIKTTTSNGIYLTLKVEVTAMGFVDILEIPNVFVGVKNGTYYMYLPKLACKDPKYQECVRFSRNSGLALAMAKKVIESHFFKDAMPVATKVEVKEATPKQIKKVATKKTKVIVKTRGIPEDIIEEWNALQD